MFSNAFKDSLSYLQELSDDGLTVAPSDPSPQMVRAGMQASGLTEESVRKIYQAMIRRVDEEMLDC